MENVVNINNMHQDLNSCWTQKMAEFESRLQAALTPTGVSSSPTLTKLSDDFYSFKNLMQQMLSILQQQITKCLHTVDEMDMRQRQKILLFTGIAEGPNTDLQTKLLDLINKQMGCTKISSSTIKRCHRLGPLSSDRPRPVLIHFKDHHSKAEVWKSKAKLKGTPFTVTEFLTKSRQAILKKARLHFGFHNVWTFDGAIYIKLPNGSRTKIFNNDDYSNLSTKWPYEDKTAANTISIDIQSQNSASPTGITKKQLDQRLPSGIVTRNDDTRRTRRAVLKK